MNGNLSIVPSHDDALFPGFFIGGFECSSHRGSSGARLDLLRGTRHIEFAVEDYRRLADTGIRVARDGFAWHRIEPEPGRRDFSSLLPLVNAARRTGTRVIWDLLHFGWPDDLDIFSPVFVDRFAALARDFAILMAYESDEPPWICAVNEISFLSWIAGDMQGFHPYEHGRGFELKCQLVRATIAAIEAVRDVAPGARVFVNEPAYNVVPQTDLVEDAEAAEMSRMAQFQATDLISGRLWPQLGGRPEYLDVVGVNYYPWNQWVFGTPVHPGSALEQDDPRRRPFSGMLAEWQSRYGRPVYIGETGTEGKQRAAWFRSVCDEVAEARRAGVDVAGICLYPIASFPGWENDRHCQNGLWEYADDNGHRDVHEPLAAVLRAQQRRFAAERDRVETPRWPRDPALAFDAVPEEST